MSHNMSFTVNNFFEIVFLYGPGYVRMFVQVVVLHILICDVTDD